MIKYLLLLMLMPLSLSAKDAEIFYIDGTVDKVKDISVSDESRLKNMTPNSVVSISNVVGLVTLELVIVPSNVKKVQFE